jgi:hypothetical protein
MTALRQIAADRRNIWSREERAPDLLMKYRT